MSYFKIRMIQYISTAISLISKDMYKQKSYSYAVSCILAFCIYFHQQITLSREVPICR